MVGISMIAVGDGAGVDGNEVFVAIGETVWVMALVTGKRVGFSVGELSCGWIFPQAVRKNKKKHTILKLDDAPFIGWFLQNAAVVPDEKPRLFIDKRQH
jgi:hypothetical protein